MKVCLAIVICSVLAFGQSAITKVTGVSSYGAKYVKPQPVKVTGGGSYLAGYVKPQPLKVTGGSSYGARYVKPQPLYRTYSRKQLNTVLVAAQSYYSPSYNPYGK